MNSILLEAMRPSITKCRPPGELEARSIANFEALAEPHRERCVAQLRRKFKDAGSVNAVVVWAYEYGAGMAIGSDDPRFHFGLGMAVRNALRAVVPDNLLSASAAEQNWDDFYYGALHHAVKAEVESHGNE